MNSEQLVKKYLEKTRTSAKLNWLKQPALLCLAEIPTATSTTLLIILQLNMGMAVIYLMWTVTGI